MNNRSLNMLLAARSLLDSSGPPLTHSSDAFTVSRKVLIVHDVAELVLAASTVELGSAHKLTEQASFHDLAAYVVSKIRRDLDDAEQRSLRNYLMELNHARVRFKHHGDLLDPQTTYPIVARALDVIDDLCFRISGSNLSSLDAVILVANSTIADELRNAERLIVLGSYRESLITIGRALSGAFSESQILDITVGKPRSDDALILSGRGIDPATFLSMQRFLPEVMHSSDGDPRFNTREYGHEANWTAETAKFCWDTALTIIMRLQSTPEIPQAKGFYDEFEDLVTISCESTEVHRHVGPSFSRTMIPDKPFEGKLGDCFWGKAKGFYERSGDQSLNFELPIGEANWIRLESHNLEQLSTTYLYGIDELWFKAEDVIVDYRESTMRRMLRKYAPTNPG